MTYEERKYESVMREAYGRDAYLRFEAHQLWEEYQDAHESWVECYQRLSKLRRHKGPHNSYDEADTELRELYAREASYRYEAQDRYEAYRAVYDRWVQHSAKVKRLRKHNRGDDDGGDDDFGHDRMDYDDTHKHHRHRHYQPAHHEDRLPRFESRSVPRREQPVPPREQPVQPREQPVPRREPAPQNQTTSVQFYTPSPPQKQTDSPQFYTPSPPQKQTDSPQFHTPSPAKDQKEDDDVESHLPTQPHADDDVTESQTSTQASETVDAGLQTSEDYVEVPEIMCSSSDKPRRTAPTHQTDAVQFYSPPPTGSTCLLFGPSPTPTPTQNPPPPPTTTPKKPLKRFVPTSSPPPPPTPTTPPPPPPASPSTTSPPPPKQTGSGRPSIKQVSARWPELQAKENTDSPAKSRCTIM